MGPLGLVLTKNALCLVLEKHWSPGKAPERVERVLGCSDERELEAAYKELGVEMMDRNRRAGAKELVEAWRGARAAAPELASREDEDDEAAGGGARIARGIAKNLGRAFSRQAQEGGLPSGPGDHAGPVTDWGQEEPAAAAPGALDFEVAKAEMSAVVRSRLGSQAEKIVLGVEQASDPGMLGLAVGQAQRQLVGAGMPRLAAKMAKKWQTLRPRLR